MNNNHRNRPLEELPNPGGMVAPLILPTARRPRGVHMARRRARVPGRGAPEVGAAAKAALPVRICAGSAARVPHPAPGPGGSQPDGAARPASDPTPPTWLRRHAFSAALPGSRAQRDCRPTLRQVPHADSPQFVPEQERLSAREVNFAEQDAYRRMAEKESKLVRRPAARTPRAFLIPLGQEGLTVAPARAESACPGFDNPFTDLQAMYAKRREASFQREQSRWDSMDARREQAEKRAIGRVLMTEMNKNDPSMPYNLARPNPNPAPAALRPRRPAAARRCCSPGKQPTWCDSAVPRCRPTTTRAPRGRRSSGRTRACAPKRCSGRRPSSRAATGATAAGAGQAAGPGQSLRARWARVLTAAPLRLCEPARSQPFNPITGAPVMPVSSMMSQAPGRGGGASQGPSSYSGSAMGSVLGGGPASFASRQD